MVLESLLVGTNRNVVWRCFVSLKIWCRRQSMYSRRQGNQTRRLLWWHVWPAIILFGSDSCYRESAYSDTTDAAIGIIGYYSAYELDVPYLQLYFVPYSTAECSTSRRTAAGFCVDGMYSGARENAKPRGMIDLLARSATEYAVIASWHVLILRQSGNWMVPNCQNE